MAPVLQSSTPFGIEDFCLEELAVRLSDAETFTSPFAIRTYLFVMPASALAETTAIK
jgi:hypothetical protein